MAQDYNEALRLFRLAAAQGNAEGQYFLGEMYLIGVGVTKDHNEALRLFRLSAAQGDAGAKIALEQASANSAGLSNSEIARNPHSELCDRQQLSLRELPLARYSSCWCFLRETYVSR